MTDRALLRLASVCSRRFARTVASRPRESLHNLTRVPLHSAAPRAPTPFATLTCSLDFYCFILPRTIAHRHRWRIAAHFHRVPNLFFFPTFVLSCLFFFFLPGRIAADPLFDSPFPPPCPVVYSFSFSFIRPVFALALRGSYSRALAIVQTLVETVELIERNRTRNDAVRGTPGFSARNEILKTKRRRETKYLLSNSDDVEYDIGLPVVENLLSSPRNNVTLEMAEN